MSRLLDEAVGALRHEETALNPKRFREAVDRLEAWARRVELYVEGGFGLSVDHHPAEGGFGLSVDHHPAEAHEEVPAPTA